MKPHYLSVLGAIGLLADNILASQQHFVDINSTNASPPFSEWSTAATNIQDAVDQAVAGDEVIVNDGVYATGGRTVGTNSLVNRVAVDKPLALRSVNGPDVTTIQGYQVPTRTNWTGAVRCVYLVAGSLLSGFTLSGGATLDTGSGTSDDKKGGAVFGKPISVFPTVSNCWILSNSASSQGGGLYGCIAYDCMLQNNTTAAGGGAYWGELHNCTLSHNHASSSGGGANSTWLFQCLVVSNTAAVDGGGVYGVGGIAVINCTIVGNSAAYNGGGAASVGYLMENSICYYNSAATDANSHLCYLVNCCTTSPAGYHGITNEPLFMALAEGDFHLQTDSPCINAGTADPKIPVTDLDGNPRLRGDLYDIGAYEFQFPTSSLSYAWLQLYGLPTDGSADSLDSDGDGMNNWQEWQTGTNPTNAASVLKIVAASNAVSGVSVSWLSESGQSYRLQRGTNLTGTPAFSTIRSSIGSIGSQPPVTTYTDTNATGPGPFFYRVGIQQ